MPLRLESKFYHETMESDKNTWEILTNVVLQGTYKHCILFAVLFFLNIHK